MTTRQRIAPAPSGILGLVLIATLAACGDGERTDEEASVTEEPSVAIVEPAEGATVEGPDVRVVLEATGVEIVPATDRRPGTAHHHLFVDTELTPLTDSIPSGVSGILHLGRGQTEFLLVDLPPGEHRVIALLADWEHVPLDPPAADTVHFTVESPEGR